MHLSDKIAAMEEEMADYLGNGEYGFLQIVENYTNLVGKMLNDTIEWYFGPYSSAYNVMKTAIAEAGKVQSLLFLYHIILLLKPTLPFQIDSSSLIVVYDPPAGPLQPISALDLLSHLCQEDSIPVESRPRLLITKAVAVSGGGDAGKHRVECLNQRFLIPSEWVYGWIDHVPELEHHMILVHTDCRYAELAGREAGIHLARRLVDVWTGRKTTAPPPALLVPPAQPTANGEEAHPAAESPETAHDNGVKHTTYRFTVLHDQNGFSGAENEIASVSLPAGEVSLSRLLTALRDKYLLKYPDASLCHLGGEPIDSNVVTESLEYWTPQRIRHIYYAIPSGLPSCEGDKVVSEGIDPSAGTIGINLEKWSVAEVLASVVVKTAFPKEKKAKYSTMIQEKGKEKSFAVKISEDGDCYSFEDGRHCYSR